MIDVKRTESKKTAAKKAITLKEIRVSELKFVDADGEDLTQAFIDELPEGTEFVTLKCGFDLPEDEE